MDVKAQVGGHEVLASGSVISPAGQPVSLIVDQDATVEIVLLGHDAEGARYDIEPINDKLLRLTVKVHPQLGNAFMTGLGDYDGRTLHLAIVVHPMGPFTRLVSYTFSVPAAETSNA